MTATDRATVVHCRCGETRFEFRGEPIMTVACHCNSCQQAGAQLRSLPDAAAVTDTDGGTEFVMQRKDRVQCLQGQAMLREHRLTPASKTRRVIASCCNSPMFLEFSGGHWLSFYATGFDPADRPLIEMRTMTIDRNAGVEFSDAIPSPDKHSVRFMWRLLSAWVAMGFRVPRIDYVNGVVGE